MIRIQNYLKENPREINNTELSLLEIGINYYHLISLLWNPSNKTYTKEFLVWKTREILEILVSLMIRQNLDVTTLNERMITAIEAFTSIENEMDIYELIGVEIDNHPSNNYALSLDMKMAALFKLLDFKGITIEQIFEKY